MSSVHELFAISVLITQLQGGASVGTATGFFYSKGTEVFLITNRHVVLDEQKGLKPETLRIRLHSDPKDVTKSVDYDVALYSNGAPTWYVHPKYPKPPIDIAVIRLDQASLAKGHVLKSLSSSNFLPDTFQMSPGEDILVMGFPRGVSDTVHNLPIIRNAIISSAYDVDFEMQPFFLVDANLHPGMSGSPVMTKSKSTWQTKSGGLDIMTGGPMYFLGVHSATLSVQLASGVEPLGLGSVWYARLIEEIIDAIPKPKSAR